MNTKEAAINYANERVDKEIDIIAFEEVRDSFMEGAEHANTKASKGMPTELTAENGAKALLLGEFFERLYIGGTGDPYIVPVKWATMKAIYKKIINYGNDILIGPTKGKMKFCFLPR